MAKQRGPIKLEGTIGDITFLKTADGFIAKSKTAISASRMAADPAFQRTRENNQEFGRAGKAARLLRTVFKAPIQKARDSRMGSRLVREMVKVLQADLTSIRGLRNVIDGEAELLQGFNCNSGATLTATLAAPLTAAVDRPTGQASVSIPSFIPAAMVSAPGGSTHFRLGLSAADIDFEREGFTLGSAETGWLPLSEQPTANINLVANVAVGSLHPIFLLLGIEFTQEVNGVQYPMKNGAYNALSIIKVEGI